MNQIGRTLTETMTIILLIGILAAMATPNFLSLHTRANSVSALAEVASELRFARQLAITHRERVRVAFNLEQRAIEAHLVNSEILHHVYSYADKGIMMDEPSAGPEILFYPSGRTATPTTIRLRGRDGESRTMTVSMIGRVSGL